MLGFVCSGSLSDDSGYDEGDGVAKLIDEIKIMKTYTPPQGVTGKLQPEDMKESASVSEMMKQQDTEDVRGSAFALVMKLLNKLGALSCVKHQHKREDLGTHEVFIWDDNANTTEDESVSFGMHLHSVLENDIMRHFVDRIEDGSVAHSFKLRNYDELLIVNDQPVVCVSAEDTKSYFLNLPVDQPVTLVTRRAVGKCDGHIMYEYFIITGTIHIFEDDPIEAVSCVSVQSALGIHDLINIKFNTKLDGRSFSSLDDVILRVKDDKIHLDSGNNTPFSFDILQYKGQQFRNGGFESVIIWIVEYTDESSCYVINKNDDAEVQLLKESKAFADKKEWEAFTEGGIKWLTKSTRDSSDRHIFQSLATPGMFWSYSGTCIRCVTKSSWEAAEADGQTQFHVMKSH